MINYIFKGLSSLINGPSNIINNITNNIINDGPSEAQKEKINAFLTKYLHSKGAIYLGPDEAKRKKINAFIQEFLEDDTLSLALLKREKIENKLAYLKGYMNTLDLNDTQLKILIHANTQTIENIEALLVAQYQKELDPHLKLALQTSLSLGAIYLTPELFALYTSTQALVALMKPHLGRYENYADNLATWCLQLTLTSLGYASGNTVGSRINQLIIPTAIRKLPWYSRIPLTMSIMRPIVKPSELLLKNALEPFKQLGELAMRPETCENARDFFDIMYGQADDATLQRHHEALAVKPMNLPLPSFFAEKAHDKTSDNTNNKTSGKTSGKTSDKIQSNSQMSNPILYTNWSDTQSFQRESSPKRKKRGYKTIRTGTRRVKRQRSS